MEECVEKVLRKNIEIPERIAPGWAILAKRWDVGRTFAWLNPLRRLSKDYEMTINSAENNVMIANSMILIKRLTSL
jgi:transposase